MAKQNQNISLNFRKMPGYLYLPSLKEKKFSQTCRNGDQNGSYQEMEEWSSKTGVFKGTKLQ